MGFKWGFPWAIPIAGWFTNVLETPSDMDDEMEVPPCFRKPPYKLVLDKICDVFIIVHWT